MKQLLVLFLSYQIFGAALNAYLGYKIAKMKISPTFTWGMYSSAFALRLGTYLWSLFYVTESLKIYENYPTWMILLGYFIEAIIMGCFLFFSIRKYITYKEATKILK